MSSTMAALACYRMHNTRSYSCTSSHCASLMLLHRIALHALASSARCLFAASAPHSMSSWAAVACTHRLRAYTSCMRRVSCIRLGTHRPTCSALLCIVCGVLDRMLLHPYRAAMISVCVLDECTSCIDLRCALQVVCASDCHPRRHMDRFGSHHIEISGGIDYSQSNIP